MVYSFKPDIHTKTGEKIYVLKLNQSYSPEEFIALSQEIKNLGGYYSKIKKGFVFKNDVSPQLKNAFNITSLLEAKKYNFEELKSIPIVDFCAKNHIELVGNGKYLHLKEHDSCVINTDENIFYWNSHSSYGDIINFVQEYYQINTDEACKILSDSSFEHRISPPATRNQYEDMPIQKDPKKLLENADESKNVKRIYGYLIAKRGIDKDIVKNLIYDRLISEDQRGNINFKTYDENNELIANIKRGTQDKKFIFIDPNSKDDTGFVLNKITDPTQPIDIYFAESPIDLISYYEINKDQSDQHNSLLVSMNGLKHSIVNKVLNDFSHLTIKNVVFAVDNDKGGINFFKKIEPELTAYTVHLDSPLKHKDWNEYLVAVKLDIKKKEVEDYFKEIESISKEIVSDPNLIE